MSKAQRIDDHSAWMGSSSRDNPLPMETKMKSMSSESGVGELNPYEDKDEDIKRQQAANKSQALKNKFGPVQRN